MADFDLSLVADLNTAGVESGTATVTASIERMSAAEYKAQQQQAAATETAKKKAAAERDDAKALDQVRAAIDPTYAAQQRLNKIMADAEMLHKKGALSQAEWTRVQKMHTEALKNGAASAAHARQVYTNVGFQIQDIISTVTLGINPFVVFGQQAGQLAAALAGVGGTAGKVASFLAGPFGSVILGAITVIGLLALSNKNAKKAAEETGDALDFQALSTDELTKAVREQLVEARKAVQLSYEQATAARTVAEANLIQARSEREKTKAMLEAQKIALEIADPSDREGMGAVVGTLNAAQLEERLRAVDASIADLDQRARIKDVAIARREAEAATDASAAATLRAEKAETILQNRYIKGEISLGTYSGALAVVRQRREAEIKAIRDQEAALKKANKEQEKAATYADFGAPLGGAGGRITGRYGEQRSGHRHAGIDLAAPMGTPVYATQSGVVNFAGSAGSYGNLIKLGHGAGTETRYGHLSRIGVRDGQTVEKGDVIGNVGSTGRSTGPHLHYEVRVNGKLVDPTKGKFPIDESKVAEAGQKAADELEKFGDKAANTIERINQKYGEQPKFIAQATAATEDLDKIIAELGERKPIGFADLIEDAKEAKAAIQDALVRPYREMREESEKRVAVQILLSAGRDAEAETLQRIWALEEKLGPLTEDRKREVYGIVKAEEEVAEALARSKENQDAYLAATRSVRQEVESILAGTGKLSNLKNVFKQLQAKVLTEQLFGPVFRDLEKYVKENTGIKSSVDLLAGETERAGKEAGNFADVLLAATGRINGGLPGLPGGSTPVGGDSLEAVFDKVLGGGSIAGSNQATADQVNRTLKGGVAGLSPDKYFTEMTKRLVRPLLAGFDEALGTKFFAGLEGVIGGAAGGYFSAGIPGAILGAAKEIKGLPKGITDALGGALGGAQRGTQVAGLMKSFGIKGSTTGAQIGGAIGSFLPIPGGDIIGSIIGSFIGGAFKKTKYGTATVSGVGSDPSLKGNKSAYRDAAGDLGGAVQAGISGIAEALDAEVGDFLVSIGLYGKKARVSTSGRTGKLKSKYGDVQDFGKGGEADAIAYAIADAIADGAIKGISPAVERALKSSSDIDKATREAVKVAELERQLKNGGDSFLDALDDFAKVAKERTRLAKAYGLDLLAVEKMNAEDRKALLDEAISRQVGSLKDLLADLSYGALFEGTPTERRAKILAEIADAKQDVTAGVAGATDRLADLERNLVETSRAAFGTAGGEYAADRASAISTAEQIIASEQKRLEDAGAAVDEQIRLANETNELLAIQNGKLDTLINQGGGEYVVNAPWDVVRMPVVTW